MSSHSEHDNWSPDEIDSLENIDKEVQLVSTSSDSYPSSNHIKNKETLNNAKVKLDCNFKIQTVAGKQSKNKSATFLHSKQSNNSKGLKLHSSCDDLTLLSTNELEHDLNGSKDNPNAQCTNNPVNLKSNIKKYQHIKSKVNPYLNNTNNGNNKAAGSSQKQKVSVVSESKESINKEEYLQEINKQLTKELDEKNAILTLLQESYEHLLFKYAEAQNRIDELRFKFMSEANDSKTCFYGKKYNRNENEISSPFHCDEEFIDKSSELKSQNAVPFIKSEENFYGATNENSESLMTRPSTLPLDKFPNRDVIKATTPTDSEGLSSIITSMSGHSKILNSLDEENHGNKKSAFIKFQSGNFILEETPSLNDPFDKVKHWQNSLPPLEQIETPETTLYNVFGNKTEVFSPVETKYKGITSPKRDNDYNFLNESCPSSWREDKEMEFYGKKSSKSSIEDRCKISNSTFSLSNTFKKQTIGPEFFNKKTYHSLELFAPENGHFSDSYYVEKIKLNKNDIPPLFINHKSKKLPSLLRSSSLPAYDYDSLNSGSYKNGIYIPPLNLGNIALSDDESSSLNNHFSKGLAPTPSSFISNRSNSVDPPKSFSSCKATISKEDTFSRVSKPTVNKSTSITPDRSTVMNTFFDLKYDPSKDILRRKTSASKCVKEWIECCSDKSKNWCNVCGETISENKSLQFFLNKSSSCESLDKNKNSNKEPAKRSKPPFTRSMSFNSETNTPKDCSRDKKIVGNFVSGSSQDSLENFEMYAKNLKARSRVVIEALTAHVNNS